MNSFVFYKQRGMKKLRVKRALKLVVEYYFNKPEVKRKYRQMLRDALLFGPYPVLRLSADSLNEHIVNDERDGDSDTE